MTDRPQVYVTRKLPGPGLARLAEVAELEVWPEPGGPPQAELARRAAAADGLLCLLTDRVDGALIRACPRLRVISSCSVGLDHIDLAAAAARGIPVGHTPGVLTETTADLAFALLLAGARRLGEAERWLRAGAWTPDLRWEPDLFLGRDLHGATLGIVGLGAIGLAVARRAAGFGMRILGWSRRSKPEAAALGIQEVELRNLLRESDFVSLHVALAPETRHLIDAPALAAMKPTALLVNTARGDVVDEAALIQALRSGGIGGAALDVYAAEPLAPSSPLLRMERVTLLPHLGSASVATRTRMADLAVDNLLAGLAGRPLVHCAKAEVHGNP
jgi:glyoxylate reductase